MRDPLGCYDKSGQPISRERWGELRFTDGKISEYALIGRDIICGVEVSTVWLGIDHAFDDARPLIFETMIFGGEHDQELRRYSSEGSALIGHRQAVNNIRRGRAPW